MENDADKHEALLSKLRHLVTSATSKDRTLSQDETDVIIPAVRALLEDEFEGSRAVRGHVWNLILVVGRAFPVLLHPSIEKVKNFARQEGVGDDGKVDLWIQEGLNEGVLCGFVQKIPTQFHIMSAYLPGSVMCNESARKEFEDLAMKLKGLLQPVPKVELPSSTESVGDTISEPLSPQSSVDHTVSSVSTPSRAQAPPGPLFRRLSSKGIGARLERAFSHEQDGPVRVVLQLANNEAGEGAVTVGIVYPSSGRDPSGSFIAEVASGFNTMWGSLTKLPANLERTSLKAHNIAKEQKKGDKVKSPEHLKKNPVNFQNVWSGIAKPFVKPQSTSQTQESEATDSNLGVQTGTLGGTRKSKGSESIEGTEGQSGVGGKRIPNWLSQPGLAFLQPVLSGSDGQSAEQSKEDVRKGQHPDSAGTPSGEKKKPEFLQNLFRKSASRVVQEQEEAAEVEGGHELGSVVKKTGPQLHASIGELERELSTGDPLLRISVSNIKAELRGDAFPKSPVSAMSTETGISDSLGTYGAVNSGDEYKGLMPGGEQLVDNVKAASGLLLELSGQGTIGNDCQGVLMLCACIEKVLDFHMRNRPRPWRPAGNAGLKFFTGIGDKITKGHNIPFLALRNAQQMSAHLNGLPDGLGIDLIEGMESVSGHSHQLHAWLRSCLNSGNLVERIKALVGEEVFWGGWYEQGSIMGHLEWRAKFVDALKGLDGVKFLLAVDKWPGKEEGEEVNVWARLTGRAASSSPTLTLPQTPEVASTAPSPNPLSPTSTSSMTTVPKMSRRKSQKKKRVVTFDGESAPTVSVTETPASTPALSPLPFNSFEGSEPLSPTTLARALGMGGDELDWDAAGDRQQKEDQDVEGGSRSGCLGEGCEAGAGAVVSAGENTQGEQAIQDPHPIVAPSVDDASQLGKTFSERIDDIMKEGGIMDADAHSRAASARRMKRLQAMETIESNQSEVEDIEVPKTLTGDSQEVHLEAADEANLQEGADKPKGGNKGEVKIKSMSGPPNSNDSDMGSPEDIGVEWSLRELIDASTETCDRNTVVNDEEVMLGSMKQNSGDPVMDELKVGQTFEEIMQQAEAEVTSDMKLGRGGDFMLARRDWGSLSLEEFEDLHASDLGFSPEELAGGLDSDAFSSSSDVESVTSRQAMDALDELIGGNFLADFDRYSGNLLKNVGGMPVEVSSATKVIDPELVPQFRQEHWEGVWKDVDVIRAETVEGSSGEFTVYVIEVTASDGTNWQVTRRFRDLAALRKKVKAREGVVLPKSWDNIKKSRHITGRARLSSEIIEARNALMRQCLWDLRVEYPGSFGWEEVAFFLDAPLHILKGIKVRTGEVTARQGRTPGGGAEQERKNARMPKDPVDKSQRLLVDLQPAHTDRELATMQGGLCPGCNSLLPDFPPPKSFASYLWRSSASSGPLKCHYTNLLYCHKCHKNETEVIPADVLHNWDFTEKVVCHASKEYLTSIKTQPLLCLGAINAGLFARVPLLAKVQSLRQKVIRTLDVVKGAGSEGKAMADSLVVEAGTYGHLLEGPDFWSLRDLVDISKGSAFSSLPRWLESMSGTVGRMATSAVLKYDD